MDELISEYRLDMVAPECTPGAEWWSAKITFNEDISEVLPYLNAELQKCEYHHAGRILIWDNDGNKVAFRSNRIEIAPVKSRNEAEKVCRETVALLEDIWRRRDRISPNLKGKTPPPSLFAVLKLLPGENCTECGCLTCMAYAAALICGQAKLSECELLSGQSSIKLADMLGGGVA